MQCLLAPLVVTSAGVVDDGWVCIEGDRILEVGTGQPPCQPEPLEGWLIPGFVDTHVHGGGGGSFPVGTEVQRAINAHRRRGTTSMMASLVSAPIDALVRQIDALIPYIDAGELFGLHLEGPFLAPSKRGAHDPHALIAPTPEACERLIDAVGEHRAMITIAPELPGAIEAIETFTDAGWTVALGHSAATFAESIAAFDAGATVATHLFNAMPAMAHRSPGLVEASMVDGRIWLELILDGEHLSDATVELAMKIAPDRWYAVTDAMSAAGMPDGSYELGGLAVSVKDGVAHLAGTTTLAGSTLTLERVFARLVEHHNVDLTRAVQATSTFPARAMDLLDVGVIASGTRADLVHWVPNQGVGRVMRAGRWLD